MSYYSIVSEIAVVTVHTKVNEIHDVWPFSLHCGYTLQYSLQVLHLQYHNVNCEWLNFINLSVNCHISDTIPHRTRSLSTQYSC